jgi:linoleate 10R-lipoxygenase
LYQTENLISLLTKLPHESANRKTLTNKLIDTLWDNLQHPPLSYMGGDMKYTTPSTDNADTPGNLDNPVNPTLASGTIEYDSPDGNGRVRQTAPEAPSGIFQYRTPDGSYNVILSSLFDLDFF